jgi:predicted dehydrogenase
MLLLESTSQEYGSGLRVREGTSPDSAKIVYEDPAPVPGTDARIPPFQSLAKRLLEAILADERTFTPSFQEGVRAQFFLEGVRASAATGSWVDMG